jgi:hypothetical protein
MFTKTKLASAVALAVGTSGLVISAAHADAVFFHNLVGSPTVASIITVMNTSALNFNSIGLPVEPGQAGNLHYQFYYKQPTGDPDEDVNALPCVEFNEYLPTSQNDVQTIDITGYFGEEVDGVSTGVMFNDPSINNDWKTGQSYAMGEAVVPFRGFLIVENNDPEGGSIAGESFVMEYGVGATWGYHAYMKAGVGDYNYLEFATGSPSIVSIMPIYEISTSYLITSVDEEMNQFFEFDEETTIAYGDPFADPGDPARIGIYDRDERPISGASEQTVVCIGSIAAQDLLPTASQNRLEDGGWARLYNYRYERDDAGIKTATTKDAGVIVKLEFNIGDTVDGQPVAGTFNNALLLRPSSSTP